MTTKDKIIFSRLQLVDFMQRHPNTPVQIKCKTCDRQEWNLFLDLNTGELYAACAKCERPLELKVHTT